MAQNFEYSRFLCSCRFLLFFNGERDALSVDSMAACDPRDAAVDEEAPPNVVNSKTTSFSVYGSMNSCFMSQLPQ